MSKKDKEESPHKDSLESLEDDTNRLFEELRWSLDNNTPEGVHLLNTTAKILAESVEKGVTELFTKHREALKLAAMMAKANRNGRK